MKAYLRAISYYLPEKIITNEDLAREFPDYTVEKVASKIGVRERHVTSPGETSADLAFEAARKLFHEHNIAPGSVDFILLCTQSPDYFLPATACILQ